mmetsp:Transcript_97256/g.172139  ORF Transcript_97256/g.172139 Transcript_97256/m.172139 type:complete len:85 (+) Transcript_97256:101-355(+)
MGFGSVGRAMGRGAKSKGPGVKISPIPMEYVLKSILVILLIVLAVWLVRKATSYLRKNAPQSSQSPQEQREQFLRRFEPVSKAD